MATVRVDFDERVRQLAGGTADGMDVATAGDVMTVHSALMQVARMYPKLHLFNCDGELRGALKIKRADDNTVVAVRDTLADGDHLRLVFG